MSNQDQTPPMADDDFPEFAAPPQQRPAHASEPDQDPKADAAQQGVDEVLERLRRQREQGER